MNLIHPLFTEASRNGLSGKMTIQFLRKGNKKKPEVCHVTQELNWKISSNRSYESKLNSFGSHRCQYVQRWLGERHKGKCLQQNKVEGPGLGLCFSQSCWAAFQNWWNHEHKNVPSHFESPCNIIWKVADWQQFHFSPWQWSKTIPTQQIQKC